MLYGRNLPDIPQHLIGYIVFGKIMDSSQLLKVYKV